MIKEIGKYVCVQIANFDPDSTFLNEDDRKYFIIGHIYEWTYNSLHNMYFHKYYEINPRDFHDYFIKLEKWRNIQIDKIIEND
jgi:hypothetical protein